MQTHFTPEQLKVPAIAEANTILRKCVHCGFCTATCPTYVLLGDELDSPRGRIYLMKEMLESGAPATAETVKHIDRCLSCLSCMTTCPSGVNYMHLVDQARAHIDATYARPPWERTLRDVLAFVMPRPALFRLALIGARVMKPLCGVFEAFGARRLSALASLVPSPMPRPTNVGRPGLYPTQGARKGRVGLLMGCVQSVLEPSINATTIRLINRLGYDVVVSGEESCCGSLTLHMGKVDDAKARARRSIDQWIKADVEHVIITASGCGTTIKDYGHLFQDEEAYAEKAKIISSKALDVTEFLARAGLPRGDQQMRIAYHSACSMQHGQKITSAPQMLLRQAGFDVVDVPEGHLCCGSAGTYNILQPEIAGKLKQRKAKNITSTKPQAVATGNIGCITQLQGALGVPILHTVELLDWATGGPKPERLQDWAIVCKA
jgi:glycolate oxidase iron-sulfur subunit